MHILCNILQFIPGIRINKEGCAKAAIPLDAIDPTRSLPDELLSDIFNICGDEMEYAESTPLIVSAVCKR